MEGIQKLLKFKLRMFVVTFSITRRICCVT